MRERSPLAFKPVSGIDPPEAEACAVEAGHASLTLAAISPATVSFNSTTSASSTPHAQRHRDLVRRRRHRTAMEW